ncbi:MAG: hypothetical protein K2P58_09575 [Hyphomonadaceae bacterium]|nr:hypothetical protein [Hyphomonadaceae bacterium]
MSVSRALWISLIVGVALSGALSGCARQEEPSVAAAPASAPAEPVTASPNPPSPGPTCYFKSDDDGRGWVEVGGREAQCFAQDSCSGGLGERAGLCFKWAMSADARALPWSATLTNPQPLAHTPPPDRIYESTGEVSTECLDGGCEPRPIRVPVATPIYARPDARAPVVATIPAAECVQPGEARALSAPLRGVVLETTERFTAGEVIYLLTYDGDYTIWWRGEAHGGIYSPDSVAVRWDPETDDPRAGLWVEYTRANGQRGWARNPPQEDPWEPQTSEQPCVFAMR